MAEVEKDLIRFADKDIVYNPKTDAWEMNGMQFVNYEDALEHVDEVLK